MDFHKRQVGFLDSTDEQNYHQTHLGSTAAQRECAFPPIIEEQDDRRFGNHSMSCLGYFDRDQNRNPGSHHYSSSIEVNTCPQDLVGDGYWEHCVDANRGHRVMSQQRDSAPTTDLSHLPPVRKQDFFETLSPVGICTTETGAADLNDASVFNEELGHCKLPAWPSKRAPCSPPNFQKELSFQVKRTVASQRKNQHCYDSPKKGHYHRQEKLTTSNYSNGPSIEVAPGEFLPLRGAIETWKAVQCDYYIPSTCFACSDTIFCIQDARFVLCPMCRVVSPIDIENAADEASCSTFGVGLGFTFDELAKWQEELSGARLSASTSW